MVLTEAARRILWLTDQAMTRGITGVGLKDDSEGALVGEASRTALAG